MAQTMELGSEQRPTTVQLTSKRIKLIILIGAVSFVIGLFMMFSDDSGTAESGTLVMFLGALVAVTGKILRLKTEDSPEGWMMTHDWPLKPSAFSLFT